MSSTSKQAIKGTCFFKGGIVENIEMKRRWNGGYADIEEGSFTNSLTDWCDVFTFIPSWHFLWWCCITDFLELAVQFGMVTMFASAYPLIASFALVVSTYILQLELNLWIQLCWYTLHNIFKTLDCSEISWNSQVLTSSYNGLYCFVQNNLVEIRSDSLKLLTTMRRPAPKAAASIGAWLTIFQVGCFPFHYFVIISVCRHGWCSLFVLNVFNLQKSTHKSHVFELIPFLRLISDSLLW